SCGGMSNGSGIAQAAGVEQMRFHCANDTTKINSLLMEGIQSGLTDANELVCFYAHKLEGTPYVAHTLEGETEMLTINIDELDCTTFVETLYALVKTTINGRYSWRDYAHHLEDLRYRHGDMGDYSTRLHYMSDWIIDNSSRGNIEDVTGEISCVRYKVKTIDYMSTHRDSYPSLKDDAIFEKVKNVEVGYRNHRFPYIKKENLNSDAVKKVVKRGDFVGLVTRMEGLDLSHLGIVEKDERGNLVLLDASSIGKKVMLEPVDMKTMLMKRKSNEGVRFFRIKQ
ncbi:MAG: DUF1460 domain-containing protein, partial [Muribaculaceae bacterium]|nr:DUF1460 domain-containing protein [Muribaculaceae bacterium]